ncbi:MAG: hydroxyisourate hydrolase [Ectothiorhodospiraceae bacterium AqS1]|nr:hydroxyisourate hydrolase [Ectothiorhodospiraceae bacterium AqS1]
MGRLTTHVLDTMAGGPAESVGIELWATDSDPICLVRAVTNADGRTDPLLEGDRFRSGRYELRFMVGRYLRTRHGVEPEALFLDEIPVRFGIAYPDQNYHVPLLFSAYGYSTYRGS